MFAYSVKCGICGFEACIEKEIPLNEAGINAVLEDCDWIVSAETGARICTACGLE